MSLGHRRTRYFVVAAHEGPRLRAALPALLARASQADHIPVPPLMHDAMQLFSVGEGWETPGIRLLHSSKGLTSNLERDGDGAQGNRAGVQADWKNPWKTGA